MYCLLDATGTVVSTSARPMPASAGYVAIDDADPRVVAWLAGNTPAQLVTYASEKQWALALGGFTLTNAGTPVTLATDPVSLGLMNGKVARLAQPNAPASINWEVTPGTYATFAAADFVTAAITLADFVQAAVDAGKTVVADVLAGTFKTRADVLGYAWPANHS